MKALLIDAFDSFVHIIHNYLRRLDLDAVVMRDDVATVAAVEAIAPDLLILGPGPGHPNQTRYGELIDRFAGRTPIFGVCLGHQAIGLAYGGSIRRADLPMHGKVSMIRHDDQGCFHRCDNPFPATRYHSLIVDPEGLSPEMTVSARSEDDAAAMGLRHRRLPVESVQFHPESIETRDGAAIFARFIAAHCRPSPR